MREGTRGSAEAPSALLIRRAIAGHGIFPVLQPIAHLSDGRIIGFEALSRFDGIADWGPDRWFSEAAAAGNGVDLELAAVRAVLPALEAVPDDTYLSVNLSPAAVLDPRTASLLGPIAGRLIVELTEHSKVEDPAALAAAVQALRAQGARIAVDDLGSGFANMSLVLRLRPEVLKLDVDLVRGIDGDPDRRVLVASLVAFAGSIPAVVVAEGIETEREAITVLELGVRCGQGYLLGRPMMAPGPHVHLPEATRGFGGPVPPGSVLPPPAWGMATHVGVLAGMARERDVIGYAVAGLAHRFARRIAVTVLALAVLGGPSVVVAAANAEPGEVLYPIKLGVEDLRLALESDPSEDVAMHLEFAARRISELPSLGSDPTREQLRLMLLQRLEQHLAAVESAVSDPRITPVSSALARAEVSNARATYDETLVGVCEDIAGCSAPILAARGRPSDGGSPPSGRGGPTTHEPKRDSAKNGATPGKEDTGEVRGGGGADGKTANGVAKTRAPNDTPARHR